MPKHKPIRFREPSMPEEAKERLRQLPIQPEKHFLA